jgi:hypothetical protein
VPNDVAVQPEGNEGELRHPSRARAQPVNEWRFHRHVFAWARERRSGNSADDIGIASGLTTYQHDRTMPARLVSAQLVFAVSCARGCEATGVAKSVPCPFWGAVLIMKDFGKAKAFGRM